MVFHILELKKNCIGLHRHADPSVELIVKLPQILKILFSSHFFVLLHTVIRTTSAIIFIVHLKSLLPYFLLICLFQIYVFISENIFNLHTVALICIMLNKI